MNKFMEIAIKEAREGILHGDGGPFGCCIVKNGEVIARGHNCVLRDNDSTCHGEMEAIREACRRLGTFDLSGCELYTTGEPCLMCLGSCLWANIGKVYYGCALADNARIGFRDEEFDAKLGGRAEFKGYLEEIDREECLKLFSEYQEIGAEKY